MLRLGYLVHAWIICLGTWISLSDWCFYWPVSLRWKIWSKTMRNLALGKLLYVNINLCPMSHFEWDGRMIARIDKTVDIERKLKKNEIHIPCFQNIFRFMMNSNTCFQTIISTPFFMSQRQNVTTLPSLTSPFFPWFKITLQCICYINDIIFIQ